MQQGRQNQGYHLQRQGNGNRRPFLQRMLPWVLVIAFLAAVGFFSLKAIRDRRVAQEVAPYEQVFAENISVDGITISGMTPQQAYDALMRQHESRVNSWQLALTYRGHTYTHIGYQTLGLQVLTEQISKELKEAWELTHSGNAYQKRDAISALRAQPYERFTTQSNFDDSYLVSLLEQVADHISLQQPVDAALVQFLPDREDPFLFQEDRPGYVLNIQQAKSDILALAAAGTSGSYEMQPEELQPNVTLAELRKQYSLRSVAQTAISRSSEENRNNNIRVSLGRVNGTILRPQQVFSFNKVAGERTLRNGYFEAEEIAYGDYVTGIGGGVCQSSTTIYQAAVTANLSITSRRTHSEPVRYADPGTDATVYLVPGREIDFKFRNNTNSSIYITARVKGSGKNLIAEVRMYGESLGEGVSYQLATNILEELQPPIEPTYKIDKNNAHVLYTDEFETYSDAQKGYVVESYLVKLINGRPTGETRYVTKDTYRPKAEVQWKGTLQRP